MSALIQTEAAPGEIMVGSGVGTTKEGSSTLSLSPSLSSSLLSLSLSLSLSHSLTLLLFLHVPQSLALYHSLFLSFPQSLSLSMSLYLTFYLCMARALNALTDHLCTHPHTQKSDELHRCVFVCVCVLKCLTKKKDDKI